jgi:predicted dehydrogenase
MRHLQLAIAHQTRWSPLLAVALQEIAQGTIGRVLELRGRGKEDARRGGGEDLWVLGSHILDLMRAIAGDPTQCFATVMQGGRPAALKDFVEGPEGIGPLVGDQINAMYTFGRGVTGYFSSHRGGAEAPSRFGLQIYGTKGAIELTTGHLSPCHILRDHLWSPGRSQAKWEPLTSNGPGQPETASDGGLHAGNVLAVNDLIDCIENPTRRPKCSVYDARWTIEMIAGVFSSHFQGKPVPLPLPDRAPALRQPA